MKKDNITSRTYELLKSAIPVINRFPRDYKFILGDRLQNILNDLMEQVLDAFYAKPDGKELLISKINLTLQKARTYFRLAHDLNILDQKLYLRFTEQIQEIGFQAGAWLNSIRNNH